MASLLPGVEQLSQLAKLWIVVTINSFHEHAAMLDSEAEKTEELTEEQKEMMSVMGFTDFVSSKVGEVWLFNRLC